MDNGSESPRIRDPQINNKYITRGWERTHFESFMRRIRQARRAAERAPAADDQAAAAEEWKKIFGSRWPSEDEVKEVARAEALRHQPGRSKISSSGRVIGGAASAVGTPRGCILIP